MEEKFKKWMELYPETSIDEAKAFCLAISFYSGSFSDRVNKV